MPGHNGRFDISIRALQFDGSGSGSGSVEFVVQDPRVPDAFVISKVSDVAHYIVFGYTRNIGGLHQVSEDITCTLEQLRNGGQGGSDDEEDDDDPDYASDEGEEESDDGEDDDAETYD